MLEGNPIRFPPHLQEDLKDKLCYINNFYNTILKGFLLLLQREASTTGNILL